MHVTHHAVDRFIERVNPRLTAAQAEAEMLRAERAVSIAAGFGCSTVRLGCGAKLVLKGETVVTVLARSSIARDCIPAREVAW